MWWRFLVVGAVLGPVLTFVFTFNTIRLYDMWAHFGLIFAAGSAFVFAGFAFAALVVTVAELFSAHKKPDTKHEKQPNT